MHEIFNRLRNSFSTARNWAGKAWGWFTTDRIISTFTIVLAVAAAMQWREMHTGSRDTHDLAVSAQQQATAASTQATFASKEVDALAQQNGDLKRSLEKTDALIKEAVSQARATQSLAVEARRSANAADQAVLLNKRADRAWLELVITAPPNPRPGKQKGVSATYVNVGKTPAHVLISNLSASGGLFISDEPTFGASPDVVDSASIAFPGEGGVIKATQGSPITFPQWLTLSRGGMKIFIYARLIYKSEGDSRLHYTHACITWNPPSNTWVNCDTYNDAN